MSSMQRVIARMGLTASPVERCTEAISLVISPVALRRQTRPPSARLAYFQALKKTPVPIAASSLAILSGRLAAQLRATVAMLMCTVGAGMERHLGDVFPARLNPTKPTPSRLTMTRKRVSSRRIERSRIIRAR